MHKAFYGKYILYMHKQCVPGLSWGGKSGGGGGGGGGGGRGYNDPMLKQLACACFRTLMTGTLPQLAAMLP